MGDAGVEVAWQHRGQIERAKRTLVARGSPRWGQGRLCRRHLLQAAPPRRAEQQEGIGVVGQRPGSTSATGLAPAEPTPERRDCRAERAACARATQDGGSVVRRLKEGNTCRPVTCEARLLWERPGARRARM